MSAMQHIIGTSRHCDSHPVDRMSLAVGYFGCHEVVEEAVEKHHSYCAWGRLKTGYAIAALSVIAILLACNIAGIYGAMTITIVAATAWSLFFGAQQAVGASRKQARLDDAVQALTVLLSRALVIAFRSNLTRIACSISAVSALILLTLERFIAASGGRLAHISLAPRLLPTPAARA